MCVNIENHDGIEIVHIDAMVASYNAANADHGDAITEPGWYADGDGPYATRDEACGAVGVDPDDDDWDYLP